MATFAHFDHTPTYCTPPIYAKLLHTIPYTTPTLHYTYPQATAMSHVLDKYKNSKIWAVDYTPIADYYTHYGWTTNKAIADAVKAGLKGGVDREWECKEVTRMTAELTVDMAKNPREGEPTPKNDTEWNDYGDHATTTGRKFDCTPLCPSLLASVANAVLCMQYGRRMRL
jgi:hypothetical protein